MMGLSMHERAVYLESSLHPSTWALPCLYFASSVACLPGAAPWFSVIGLHHNTSVLKYTCHTQQDKQLLRPLGNMITAWLSLMCSLLYKQIICLKAITLLPIPLCYCKTHVLSFGTLALS